MAPQVTLCIFCYNQEAYVRQALEGAFQQACQNLTILVTDDASTDGTFARISALIEGYRGPHRVVAQRNAQNLGFTESVNQAMRLAEGDFLVMAGGDDVSVPSRCQELVDTWEKFDRKYHVLHSGFRRIDENGGPLPLLARERELQAYSEPTVQQARPEEGTRVFAPHIYGCTEAWDRTLFERFGSLKSGVRQEDVVMALRGTLTGGILFLPQPLVDYRLHSSNMYNLDFRVSEAGLVTTAREFDQLEAFKLRDLRFKAPIHDNFEADVATAARTGLLGEAAAKSLTDLIRTQRMVTAAEIALRAGGLLSRGRALRQLRRLKGRIWPREIVRILPTPLYRAFRIRVNQFQRWRIAGHQR